MADRNSPRVILLGPPGSGKGTQGRRLAAALGLAYLGTGALLREHLDRGTPFGERARPRLARGEYLPDEWMLPVLGEWLDRQPGGWVLDGFPRSLAQAVYLEDRLAGQGLRLSAAISLEAPLEVLWERIRHRIECARCRWSGCREAVPVPAACPECGGAVGPRADDGLENFRSRHHRFLESAAPLCSHYSERKLLCPCDATASSDVVAARVLEFLPAPIV